MTCGQEKMKILHLIFDFDGTIVDNLDSVFALVKEILAEKGTRLPGELKDLRQKGIRQVIKELKISKSEWLKHYRRLKETIGDSLMKSDPVEGLPEVLRELSKNCDLYVMSSNKKENITEFLEKHRLLEYFSGVYEDSSYFGKHGTLKKIIRDLKLARGEVAYVGDESRDIEATKKAGIISIAVTWGFEGETPLRSEAPDFLLHESKELLAVVG